MHCVVIGGVLFLLQVPLAVPLAALVFLGGFVPLVGALAAGGLSVLVTLGTRGWVAAVILLGVLLVENQLEAHLLQPVVVVSERPAAAHRSRGSSPDRRQPTGDKGDAGPHRESTGKESTSASGSSMPVIAVPAAVVGAASFGAASTLQQRVTKQAPAGGTLDPRLVLELVRRPAWLVATGTVFAARLARRKPDRQIVVGALAVVVGLGTFLSLARRLPDLPTLLPLALGLVVALAPACASPSLAVITVVDRLFATAIGVSWLGEHLAGSTPVLVGEAIPAIVLVGGVVVLARHPTA